MKPRLFRPALPAALLALSGSLPLAAQTSVTLDGASGSQTYDVALSTTGGLTLGLGFGVDYLIIGGGVPAHTPRRTPMALTVPEEEGLEVLWKDPRCCLLL